MVLLYISFVLYFSGKRLDNKELIAFGVTIWYLYICELFFTILANYINSYELDQLLECQNLTIDQKLKLMDLVVMSDSAKLEKILKKFI